MVSILKQNLGDLGIQSNGVLLSYLTIGYENKCHLMRYNIDIVESQIPKSNETGIQIK